MTTELLREAIEMLKARGDHDKQKQIEIKKALIEIDCIENEYTAASWDCPPEVTFISTQDAAALMNRLLYDVYGKLKRAGSIDGLLFVNFCQRAREEYGFENWTPSAFSSGYELIVDLWDENDAVNANNADGTFKRYDPDVLALLDDVLCDAIDEADTDCSRQNLLHLKRQLKDWLH